MRMILFFFLPIFLMPLHASLVFTPAIPGKQLPEKENLKIENGIDLREADHYWEKWHLVTTRYRKDSEQMRLVFANNIAWAAMIARAPKYPNGSMFAKTVFQAALDPVFPSSIVPKDYMETEFMKKDDRKFKDTGGWGYTIVVDGKSKSRFTPELQKSCFACHSIVEKRDFIYAIPAYLQWHLTDESVNESLLENSFKEIEFEKLSETGKEAFRLLGLKKHSKLKMLSMIFMTGHGKILASMASFALKNKMDYLVIDEQSKNFLLTSPSSQVKSCLDGVNFSMKRFTQPPMIGKVCDGKIVEEH